DPSQRTLLLNGQLIVDMVFLGFGVKGNKLIGITQAFEFQEYIFVHFKFLLAECSTDLYVEISWVALFLLLQVFKEFQGNFFDRPLPTGMDCPDNAGNFVVKKDRHAISGKTAQNKIWIECLKRIRIFNRSVSCFCASASILRCNPVKICAMALFGTD